MTNERLQDERVSAAYREVAGETAPPYLDEKVLRMAASGAKRPRYSRSLSWTRPLAWAATIALCLAITLEVTRVPTPDAGVPNTTASESIVEAAAAVGRARVAKEAEARDAEAAIPATTFVPQKIEQAKTRAAARKRQEVDAFYLNDAEEAPAPAAAAAPMAFEVKDADVMQHVEDLARLQSGTSNEPVLEEVVPGASYALIVPAPCSDDVKTDPDEWLACIEALEDAGDTEAALREKESLIEVFPDFKMP